MVNKKETTFQVSVAKSLIANFIALIVNLIALILNVIAALTVNVAALIYIANRYFRFRFFTDIQCHHIALRKLFGNTADRF